MDLCGCAERFRSSFPVRERDFTILIPKGSLGIGATQSGALWMSTVTTVASASCMPFQDGIALRTSRISLSCWKFGSCGIRAVSGGLREGLQWSDDTFEVAALRCVRGCAKFPHHGADECCAKSGSDCAGGSRGYFARDARSSACAYCSLS